MGKVPWATLLARPDNEFTRHQTARGKNDFFLGILADALQLDSISLPCSPAQFKKAFTPAAVRRIYEGVAELWPSAEDLTRVLRLEANHTTGLYTGTYEPSAVERAVTRHSLYSEKILLVDPFLHPHWTRAEFNPVIHPEQHRVNAIRATQLWLSMMPWIKAGIVTFIRLPRDFDSGLGDKALKTQRERVARNPELQKLLDEHADEEAHSGWSEAFREYYKLSFSDEFWVKEYRKDHPGATEQEVLGFLRHIDRRRENHPYFVKAIESNGKDSSEFLHHTSGANYEMAKITALRSGSHLITDLRFRWKEIELDRVDSKIDHGHWMPFAKAFQGVKMKHLEDVPLSAALELRGEGRLENMRAFLRRVWKASAESEEYSDENVENLAAELRERINEAEDEWKKIDRRLMEIMGAAVTAATAQLVGTGGAAWLPAATTIALGGITGIAVSTHQRSSFETKFPAAFFLNAGK